MIQKLFAFCIVFLLISGWASPQEQKENSKSRIGLVLSGGGAKGIAHIGVLKVIEEIGLPIDYIAGTSMGSIVGGLYASGYDAASLESLFRSVDWEVLLADEMDRQHLSLDEKAIQGQYAIAFPLRGYKVSLPVGMIAGQNISMLLNQLTIPVHHINRFLELPVPFLCIATDLGSGEAVVLETGQLADCMRASMSIPTIFTPVKKDGKVLVDGGLVRNLPVEELKTKGVDIIIGVDVGAAQYQQDELDSLGKIMEQSLSLLSQTDNNKQRALCDLVIEPDIKGYGLGDFAAVEKLINIGEQAARRQYDKLLMLKESNARKENRPLKKIDQVKLLNQVYRLTAVEINGLENMTNFYANGKLRLTVPEQYTLHEIENSITRLYGSGYFKYVKYQLESHGSGERLIINLEERDKDYLKFGFAYDDEVKSAIIINTTFKNLWMESSTFIEELRLSENPGWQGRYFLNTLWQPGIRIGIEFSADQLKAFTNNAKGNITGYYNFIDVNGGLFLETNFSNTFVVGVSLDKEYTHIKSLANDNEALQEVEYIIPNAYVHFDNLDHYLLPAKGMKLNGEFEWYSTDGVISSAIPKRNAFMRARLEWWGALSVIEETISIQGKLYTAFTNTQSQDTANIYYLASKIITEKRAFPMISLKTIDPTGIGIIETQMNIQWKFWKRYALIMSVAIGQSGGAVELFQNINAWSYGYGVQLGIDTIMGPFKAVLSKSNTEDEPRFSLHLGYKY